MSLTIRRIRADEWQRLRALRLHALADAPTAFGSTLAREEAFAETVWRERAAGGAAGDDRVTVIAEQDGRWVGLATCLLSSPDEPEAAVPTLVGMFVEGSARRQGIGKALVDTIVGWARNRGAARLALCVTSSNRAAVALYSRCGFRLTSKTKALAHTPALWECEMMREVE